MRKSPKEVVIVDGAGANLASLVCAFERLGAKPHVSADARTISGAPRVVLPGVGAARHAMERLRGAGLVPVLKTLTQPVLGICLGMQLLFEWSAEGATKCLGLLPRGVQRLSPSPRYPVPHMGWNELASLRPDPLLEGVGAGDYAYFVHSYAARMDATTLATVSYGQLLSAVVRWGNFWGTQFHPERSSTVGARVLENFLNL